MLEGACHCGSVRWSFDGFPQSATACNCTLCRRYATLWAYDVEGEKTIKTSGTTRTYVWAEGRIAFHFCPDCGCVAYWREILAREDGRRRIAVNLRLADPKNVGGIIVDHLDGLDTWKRARDGRCVADMWF